MRDRLALGPMRAVPGRLPVHKQGWAWELKSAGVRALAAFDDGGVTLLGPGGRPVAAAQPALAAMARPLGGRRMVLDGVVTSLGGRAPVSYRAFDILCLDGQDLTGESYLLRRKLLASLALDRLPGVEVPPSYRDLSATQLAQLARDHGVEGIVGKRLASPYRLGRESEDWIELVLLRGCEAVIGGWLPERGGGEDRLGSVLLGVYDQARRLVYIGRVSTGFTQASRRAVRAVLRELARDECPFGAPLPAGESRFARWVHPTLVAEVGYRAIGAGGRLERPSWRGLRTDIDPHDPVWRGSLRLQLDNLPNVQEVR